MVIQSTTAFSCIIEDQLFSEFRICPFLKFKIFHFGADFYTKIILATDHIYPGKGRQEVKMNRSKRRVESVAKVVFEQSSPAERKKMQLSEKDTI